MNHSRALKFGAGFDDMTPTLGRRRQSDENADDTFVRGGVEVTPETGGFAPPDVPENKPATNGKKGLFSNPLVLMVVAIVVVYLVLRS